MSHLHAHSCWEQAHKIVCGAGMKLDMVEAVLDAADEWVSTHEALLAARQASEETDTAWEAIDIAGSRLVVAITRWRRFNR